MGKAFISRVRIKNYRNFLDLDIFTHEKQLVLGENSSGKSNYLRALRLILDQSFSDNDRELTADDFNDILQNPLEKGEIIEISIYISNYEENSALMNVIGDAKVNEDGFSAAKITYIYEPINKEDLKMGYRYSIYKGNNKTNKFDSYCRKYLNIKVINALRDVNEDFISFRKSPVFNIIKKYGIEESNVQFKAIVDEITSNNQKIFEVDEMSDARNYIKSVVNPVLRKYNGSEIDLGLVGSKIPKILGQLRILEKGDCLSGSSLGITNIIYILLTLAANLTPPIPTFISCEKYLKLTPDQIAIIDKYYKKTPSDNYVINQENELTDLDNALIYSVAECIDEYIPVNTIIAIEEPEAHLHPAFIRMIYKDIFEGENTVIFTSHSPEIASICPLRYYVDIKKDETSGISTVTSGFDLPFMLKPNEISNLERYIDTNRADIFFGRNVILVEGICEKMILPKFAKEMNIDLDSKGTIICNIASVNFLPYCNLLNFFKIPYIIITDGDCGVEYNGIKRMQAFTQLLYTKEVFDAIKDWDEFFTSEGIFIGERTLEHDILKSFHSKEFDAIIKTVFNITQGQSQHKQNFKDRYESSDFDYCYRLIDGEYIGKANFIQDLSLTEFSKEVIPKYIANALKHIGC